MRVCVGLTAFVLVLVAAVVSAAEPPLAIINSPVVPLEEKASERGDEGSHRITLPPSPTALPPRYSLLTVGELGTAKGVILQSFKGRNFYSFMSLPYAMPPVEDLRFQYPQPWTGKWAEDGEDGSYDASYLRARCPQASMLFNDIVSGREDCLHLNVYTPIDPVEGRNLTVMVFLHGGAYMTGDASLYVPTKLMDRDVIVVTVQYRLGMLGFLAGGVKEAPGNMGLMDQVQALRWVQDYIHYFGGDPDHVTVFGQSAGGASASWMYLTPLTKETAANNKGRQLLTAAIAQSGSALEEWTIDDQREQSFNQSASLLGCLDSDSTPKKVVRCMRKASFEDVVQASLKLYSGDRKGGGLGFRGLCPVIQEDLIDSGIEVLIPKDPREILSDGEFLKIPVMTGSVRDEGSLVVGLIYKDYMLKNNYTEDDEDFLRSDALPMLMNAFGIEDKTGSVTSSMRVAYLPDATMGDWDSMVGGMIDMSGVMFLKSGLWEGARRAATADPDQNTFFYSWEFQADDSLFDFIFLGVPDLPVPGGISHADELLYLFHLPADHDQRQRAMVDRMTKIWTNFAKYGNPTPEQVEEAEEEWRGEMDQWLPYSVQEPHYMLVQDNFTLEKDYVTRWNYHLTDHRTTTQGAQSTTPSPETVGIDDYNKIEDKAQSFEIATAILGAITGCVLVLLVVLTARGRIRRNAIV